MVLFESGSMICNLDTLQYPEVDFPPLATRSIFFADFNDDFDDADLE